MKLRSATLEIERWTSDEKKSFELCSPFVLAEDFSVHDAVNIAFQSESKEHNQVKSKEFNTYHSHRNL